MPQNVACDQDLHCVHYVLEFLEDIVLIKTNQTLFILEMDRSKEWR